MIEANFLVILISMRNPKEIFSASDHRIISVLLEKLNGLNDSDNTMLLMPQTRLDRALSSREKRVVRKFLAVDPRDYGFRGNFLGIPEPPANLIEIAEQTYNTGPDRMEQKTIRTQYLPLATYRAYQNMNEQVQSDLGKGLFVESGYRSPAYQIVTLLRHFKEFDFDLAKTLSLVAFPGYSEHGFPPRQAIDLATENGIGQGGVDEHFAKTEEYEWLLKKASKYGFVLSYTQGNPDGIAFEPWHWSHRG